MVAAAMCHCRGFQWFLTPHTDTYSPPEHSLSDLFPVVRSYTDSILTLFRVLLSYIVLRTPYFVHY